MSLIGNFFAAVAVRLSAFVEALMATARLIGILIQSRATQQDALKERLLATLTTPISQRLVFTVLRFFLPNLVISRKLVEAYDNSGTAIVTRFDDVQEILARDEDFEVVYGPHMKEITDGHNFFLGMQNTPRYTRDVSNMRLAVRRDDVLNIIQPFAAHRAGELVAASNGRLDVPRDLTLRVPAELVGEYFGTPGPSVQEMIDWTTIMFWYLFIDLAGDPKTASAAIDAARKCRAYLDQAIRDRKTTPTDRDDVLNRCLAMQGAGLPGTSDLDIRNNLIGLIIGAVPTTSKAAVQALDQLLDRPEALAGAQNAARKNNDDLLARHIFEALRFNPVNPIIYRRAVRDTVIARGTLRARRVPAATMVLAANLSAMFDPLRVSSPNEFRPDRPWHNYILWGKGLHTCFGAHINMALIPTLLKPLLQRNGLRRAKGEAGQIDAGGTPFPSHLVVEFD